MTKPISLLTMFALLSAIYFPVQAQTAEQPDVLFIAIDDLNDWVGPLGGHPQSKTPNIDRLAAMGTVFSNAYAPAALCSPSRAAIMTGVSSATSGVYANGTDWRKAKPLEGVPTIPRFFRDNGYRSVGAGKLFHASTYNTWAYFGYNDTTAWEAYFPSLERQLPDESTPHDRPANGSPLSQNFDWSAVSTTDMAMGDGQVVTWSVEQILVDSDTPKFNAVGIYRPHLPWYLPQKYFDMHPLENIILPEVLENDLDDIPEAMIESGNRGGMSGMGIHDWIAEDESKDRWREGVRAYLASISYADAMVGHLLDALEQSGRADNTIIVLWSDHGWHLGEKGRWRKQTLWRESTRVPFIVVAPGVTKAGSKIAATVSLLDLYPTLVELAGLDIPTHPEGISLLPLIEDPDIEWDHAAISTNDFGNHAVSTDQYRYIQYVDDTEELYDIKSDPNEWHNLAGDPELGPVKERLIALLPKHDESADRAASRNAD
ncbi:MAG TPA: iduronate-2-sulfatase [Gammaproteobacteria bacterium]|jgi:arylsulfatase A-like enzyme|nr:iduronate-2-sulfatase [Gammaproteobacteria bacterium]